MKLPLKDIKPNPHNPRFIKDDSFKKLVQSLRDFPEMAEVREIVLNKDHVILGGNMRFKAMQAAGWTEAPVKIVDWPEDKQIEFVIKDNVSGGEWDWDVLANEWDTEQLDEWGLDIPADLSNPEEIEEDEAPEVSGGPAASELGAIYQLGRHRVMCGDSTDMANVELLMNGAKADMVFTDPPYGVDYKGINNDSRAGLEELIDAALGNMSSACKDGASVYMFHSDRCADIFHNVFRAWCHFSSMIIWVKPSLVLSQSDYHSRHEPCLYGWFNTGKHTWYSDRKQDSVWEMGKENVEGHTTPKPIEVVSKAITNSSQHDDKVLDVFLGSGSTLIACEQTDRICYGMELDPKYVDVIRKRYVKYIDPENWEESWQTMTPAI